MAGSDPILILYEYDDPASRQAFVQTTAKWPSGVVAPILCFAFSRQSNLEQPAHDVIPTGYRMGPMDNNKSPLKNQHLYAITHGIKLTPGENFWDLGGRATESELLSEIVECYSRALRERGLIINCTSAYRRLTQSHHDTPVANFNNDSGSELANRALKFGFSHQSPLQFRILNKVATAVDNSTGVDINLFHRGWLLAEGFSDGIDIDTLLAHGSSVTNGNNLVERLLDKNRSFDWRDDHYQRLATWIGESLNNQDSTLVKIWIVGASPTNLAKLFDVIVTHAGGHSALIRRLKIYVSEFTSGAIKAVQGASKNIDTLLPQSEHKTQIQSLWRHTVIHSKHNLFVDAPYRDMDLIICPWILGALTQDAQSQLLQVLHSSQRTGATLLLSENETKEIQISGYIRSPGNGILIASGSKVKTSAGKYRIPKVALGNALESKAIYRLDESLHILSCKGITDRFNAADYVDGKHSENKPIHDVIRADLRGSTLELLAHTTNASERNKLVLTRDSLILITLQDRPDLAKPTRELWFQVLENVDIQLQGTNLEPLKNEQLSNQQIAINHVQTLHTEGLKNFKSLEHLSIQLASDNEALQSEVAPLKYKLEDVTNKLEELEDQLTQQRNNAEIVEKSFYNATMPMMICNPNGKIERLNRAFSAMFETTLEDAQHIANPALRLPVQELLERIVVLKDSDEPELFSFLNPRTGSPCQLIMSNLLNQAQGDSAIQIQVMPENSKQIEEAEFIHGLELLGIGSVITNSMGIVQFIDPRVCEWMDLSGDNNLHQPFEALLQPGYQELHQNMFATLKTGQAIDYEAPLARINGELVWIRIRAMQLHPEHSDHFLFLVENIREKKRNEKETMVAQKLELLGQITGGVAHDFNNILAVVMGYIELMTINIEDLSANDMDRYLAQMKDACERARDLIQQMLFYSRGDKKQNIKKQNLAESITTALPLLRTSLRDNINLTTDFAAEAAMIEMDPTHLHQILMNLSINARDAIAECRDRDGEIVISTAPGFMAHNLQCASCSNQFSVKKPDKYVVLSVTDNGSGIPPEALDQMFDPFFSTKPVNQGSGMGLSVIHGLVHQYKGHLQVLNSNYGVQFRLWLPVASRSRDVDASLVVEEGSTAVPNWNVLLVEDDESVASVLSKMLKQLDLGVVQCSTGVEAARLIKQNQDIDLVITDLSMPGMNGIDVAAYCEEFAPNLPVIILTGSVSNTDSVDMPANTAAILRKPATIHQISKTLQQLSNRIITH